jgi:hypothetical protein
LSFSVELVIGIIGIITAILSLIVHLIRLRKERPRLEVEAIYGEHWFFNVDKDREKPIFRLNAGFRVKNLGDRGTTLHKAQLSFMIDNKQYSVQQDLFEIFPGPKFETTVWINAHEITEIGIFFAHLEGETITQESIVCTFTLFHTHGKKKVQGISKMNKEAKRKLEETCRGK